MPTQKRQATAISSSNDDYQNVTIQLTGAVVDSIVAMYLYTMPRPTQPPSVNFNIYQAFGPSDPQPAAVLTQNGDNWQFTVSLLDPVQWQWGVSINSVCGTAVTGQLDNVYGWQTPSITVSLAPALTSAATPALRLHIQLSSTHPMMTRSQDKLDTIGKRVKHEHETKLKG